MLPGTKVMVLAGGLLVATAAVLTVDRFGFSHRNRAPARQFQRMAGGLGLGASVCPRWCFINFDPRLEHCTCMEQPLPGGYCYCPEHTDTVSFFSGQGPNLPGAAERGGPAP